MPRDGTLTGLSAFFSTTVALALIGTDVTLFAQIYRSTAPDNTFVPVPGTEVTLAPVLTGILGIGTIAFGNTGPIAVPVDLDDRLLLVVRVEVTAGLDIATVVTGYVSAGLSIA